MTTRTSLPDPFAVSMTAVRSPSAFSDGRYSSPDSWIVSDWCSAVVSSDAITSFTNNGVGHMPSRMKPNKIEVLTAIFKTFIETEPGDADDG